jgi:WD40 repeat protein/tRNA A-37 threonylcarbamoyl transferase component Bud32/tetratricopeptide (TPR) repeat protein
MGTVYRAEQTRPVKRRVALKLIKVGMDSRVVLARFDAERQALALMDHPNIARVYDGGTTAASQPFFVMELVEGVPITEYCDQRRLRVRARLELFVAVRQAVQHAHQKGIIHRDLKPSNILVTEVEGRPTPKVIDFGVAKAMEFRLTEQSLADTGAIVGTPTYMSPEQADPSSMDIDTRTDVYALGVILYELLAGSPPIDAKQFKRGAFLEMLRMVREVDPPRPSTKVSTAEALPSIAARRDIDPEHLKRALKGDLDWIVMKALEKDRTRRYETANGFAADVLRHLANEPVVAAPPSRAYRMRKFVRKNRGRVIAASLMLTALVVGIVGTTLGLFQARRQEQIAQTLATKEAEARGRAEDLATKEAKARGEADAKAEQLAREDYVNRVNRAYREVQDDNISLAEDLLHGCEPVRRAWEWYFVERLCNSERRVLELGDTSVNALAYSPDGTWVVAGSGSVPFGVTTRVGPTVDVWDVNSGQLRKALPGAKGTLLDVAVSPDGKKVAAGCSAGVVLVWDVETGRSAWTRNEPELASMSLAFSPDGKSLAVGYGKFHGQQVGRVKVWDAASGKERKAFAGPRGGVNKVAFHPDGKRLAVAGSGVVEIWDVENVRKLHELEGHKKWVYCLAYSLDGKWLATGAWDGTVKLRDSATGVEALTIFAHEGYVLSLAFSPDSRNLVTTSEDRSVRLWELPSGRRVSTFHGHTDFVQTVAFRPDGCEVGTGSVDGSIRFWDLRTSRPVVVEHADWVNRLAFRRDSLRVLSESWRNGTAPGPPNEPPRDWNPVTGELDATLAGTNFEPLPADYVRGPLGYLERINSRQFSVTSPDGKLVASAGDSGNEDEESRSKEYSISSLIIREARSGRFLRALTGHSADVVSLGFSPDGSRLATASFDRTVKLWDTTTWQDVFTLRGHTAGVVCLAFSPDGNQIVTGGIDFTARAWNATPLPSNMTAEHDARYRKKIATLTQLQAATDDAQRAEILASGGQWGTAAEAFARAVEKEPETIQQRYQLVDALLQAGDRSRVGPACDDILKRFGNSGDPIRALTVSGLCRLASQAITDPEKRQAVHALALATNDLQRGLVLGQYGQWDLVASIFTKVVEEKFTDDKPEGLAFFGIQLLSRVEMGDLPGYRSAAGKLVSQFSKTSDPNSLNNAAWFCTYAPDAVADLAVPVQMAEKALAGYPPAQKRFALNTLGAALYRAGRIDEAIARLDESVKASGGVGVPQDWAFLAMAHHKKGNDDEARRCLEKLRSHKPDEKVGFSTDAVECRIFLREAEALLRETPPARP